MEPSGHVLQRDLGGDYQGYVYVYVCVCVVIKLYIYNFHTLLYTDVSVFKKKHVGRPEGESGWGTHVNPWLIHVNVWQ